MYLPAVLPMLVVSLVFKSILNPSTGLLNTFLRSVVFVLTNGGPGRATDTVYTAIFDEFSKGRYGVVTTLSTILFLIMIVLGFFVIRLMHRDATE